MRNETATQVPQKKIEILRGRMAAADWRGALALAATFPRLGEHKQAILRGWEACARPDFQCQLGRNPAALLADGIAALRARYVDPAAPPPGSAQAQPQPRSTPMTTTTTTAEMITTLRAATPAKRAKVLPGFKGDGRYAQIAAALGIELKPRTPTPAVERLILSALAAEDAASAEHEMHDAQAEAPYCEQPEEDRADAAIAAERLAEIAEHPERIVRGAELDEALAALEIAPPALPGMPVVGERSPSIKTLALFKKYAGRTITRERRHADGSRTQEQIQITHEGLVWAGTLYISAPALSEALIGQRLSNYIWSPSDPVVGGVAKPERQPRAPREPKAPRQPRPATATPAGRDADRRAAWVCFAAAYARDSDTTVSGAAAFADHLLAQYDLRCAGAAFGPPVAKPAQPADESSDAGH